MTVDEYFTSVERGLSQHREMGAVLDPIECIASDDCNGLLCCRVSFWDGSYMDLHETVSTELGYPVRLHYAYAYVREGQCLFRYDNAPHHPEIATHPNHKHVGESGAALPSDQPSLRQVLGEIERHLASSEAVIPGEQEA